MSRPESDALNIFYKETQENYRVTDTGVYGDLVVPTGNSNRSVHRWFHMKEAFSHSLLGVVLQELALDPGGLTCIDPFAGSGTTAVSLAQLVGERRSKSARYFGVEVNPFLQLLASTKLRALQSPPSDFEAAAARVARRAMDVAPAETPELSTFKRGDYFLPDQVDALMRLVAACTESAGRSSDITSDLLRVAVAATVEASSQLRRDGRTLRYVEGKVGRDPLEAFCDVASRIADDLGPRAVDVAGHVVLRDSRVAGSIRATGDLALFSPPYPNNIDYSEVYKLEAWALGLVKDQAEFKDLRRRTVRSHGSLRWNDERPIRQAAKTLVEPVLGAIPADRYKSSRDEVVLGYVEDMWLVFENLVPRLRPGGHVVCVVGNSLHGRGDSQFLIASDLLLAEVATRCGLEVTRIEVARYPRRRRSESEFLRESLVFARVPA